MAGLEGRGKEGRAQGGDAIPRVTESGRMWRRQPGVRAGQGSALSSSPPSPPLSPTLSPSPRSRSGKDKGSFVLSCLSHSFLPGVFQAFEVDTRLPRLCTFLQFRLPNSPSGARVGSLERGLLLRSEGHSPGARE